MPDHACLVTVVIPVFNSATTLWRAARSALKQSVWPLEVIIVDDASRDASLAEAHRIAECDSRVRVIALPENRGKSHAMNRAIAEARGRWIAVLDADDSYADDRLAILLGAAESRGADLAADNQSLLDAGAGRVVGSAFAEDRPDGPLTRGEFIAGCDAHAPFNYGMLKPIVRACFVRRTGLRYRESARLSEDFLWLVEFFAARGTAVLVSRPLYEWTQAFGSVSRRWTETGAGAWRYDFLQARAANAEVRNVLRAPEHNDLIALLDRRDHALRQLHWLREMSRARREGSVAELPRLLLAHPSIWPILTRRVAAAAVRRAAGFARASGPMVAACHARRMTARGFPIVRNACRLACALLNR